MRAGITEEAPLVSIVTPACNAARFIKEAIESVKAQTYQNWEMLIVDDGSRDKTPQIVEKMMVTDSRIKLFSTTGGQGPAIARNIAIEKAQGRFIAFLDSDDLWLPTKLEKQINYMLHEGYAFTFTNFRRTSEDEKRVGRILPVPNMVRYEDLLKHNTIGALTVIIDRRLIETVSMRQIGHEDFILWLGILKSGIIGHGLQEDLARYRVVKSSISHNKLRSAKWVWNILKDTQSLTLYQAIWYFLNYVVRASYKYTRFSYYAFVYMNISS